MLLHLLATMITVTVARAALTTIQQTTATADDGLETGGILLGHQTRDGAFLITMAGTPGPNAIREAKRFRRDSAHANDLADAAWRNDRSVWIGDWHSHPDGQTTPSQVDLTSYLDVLADEELKMTAFVAVIVTPGESGRCALYPWLVTTAEARQVDLWVH